VNKISPWIEDARASLRETALKRIDFNSSPSNLFKSIQNSFMHMGIFIDAEKEGYMEEIENLIKAMHQDQIGTIRNSIRQLVIDFLVKKIR